MNLQELKIAATNAFNSNTKMNAKEVAAILNENGINAKITDGTDTTIKNANGSGNLIVSMKKKAVKRLSFAINGKKFNGNVNDGIALADFLMGVL